MRTVYGNSVREQCPGMIYGNGLREQFTGKLQDQIRFTGSYVTRNGLWEATGTVYGKLWERFTGSYGHGLREATGTVYGNDLREWFTGTVYGNDLQEAMGMVSGNGLP